MCVRRELLVSKQPLYTFPMLSSSSWQEQPPVATCPIRRFQTRPLRCHRLDPQRSRRDQRGFFSSK